MPINEVQQTVKQHAVPQNIMQVEFKVIGDLTMRQFFYLVIASILAFAFYKSNLPYIVKMPLSVGMALVGIAVAFLPVGDRGVDQWIANFIAAIYSPTQRVWRKEPAVPNYFMYENANLVKTEMLAIAPTASRRKLEQFLEHREQDIHDKVPDGIEQQENEYIRKVKEAFETAPVSVQQTASVTLTSVPVEVRPTPPIPTPSPTVPPAPVPPKAPPLPPVPVAPIPPKPPTPLAFAEEVTKKPEPPVQKAPNASVEPPKVEMPKKEVAEEKPKKQEQDIAPINPIPTRLPEDVKPFIQAQKRGQEEQPKVAKESVPPFIEKPTEKNKEQNEQIIDTQTRPKPAFTKPQIEITRMTSRGFEAITPDRLTGRKFTQLTPSQGEIVLPIRGMRTIELPKEPKETQIPESKAPQDIKKQASQLSQFVEKIRKEQPKVEMKQPVKPVERPAQKLPQVPETPFRTPTPAPAPAKPPEPARPSDEVLRLKEENQRLAKQVDEVKQQVLAELRQQMSHSNNTEEEKKKIKEQMDRLESEKTSADSKVNELTQKIVELEKALIQTRADAQKVELARSIHMPTPTETAMNAVPPSQTPKPESPKPVTHNTMGPSLTTIPNIINGTVKDSNDVLVEGAVVIIKDLKGDVVRALKSNKLGQFAITTPVATGTYIVEASYDLSKMEFEPVRIEVSGKVLSAIEFVGKL